MYAWRSHTAEVELYVEASSAEGVFEDALDAFGRLVEREGDGEPAAHDVELEAPDRAGLLVAWLEELIFLADTASFVPDRAAALRLGEQRLEARVEGRRSDLDPIVKAATYHGLAFAHEGGQWRARVVLDV